MKNNLFQLDLFDTYLIGKNCYKLEIDGDINQEIGISEIETPAMIKAFTVFSKKNIAFFEDNRFSLITTRNTYLVGLERIVLPHIKMSNSSNITFASQLPNPPLEVTYDVLLERLLIQSRFYRDDKIGYVIAKNIYLKWFENYFSRQYGEDVIIILDSNIIVGLLFYKFENLTGLIDLVVVHPDWQNLGIGKTLFASFYEVCKLKGLKQIKVETEGDNIASNKYYQNLGFNLSKFDLVYHKHLSENL